MAMTITAAPTAGRYEPAAAPPPKAATPKAPPPQSSPAKSSIAKADAQSSAAATAASSGKQQAALTHMLATYARDQAHGTDARTLAALGKQIMAAAKALNQHVTLPHTAAGANTTPSPDKGKIDVMA